VAAARESYASSRCHAPGGRDGDAQAAGPTDLTTRRAAYAREAREALRDERIAADLVEILDVPTLGSERTSRRGSLPRRWTTRGPPITKTVLSSSTCTSVTSLTNRTGEIRFEFERVLGLVGARLV
jgi:hypothetical protein